MYVFVLFLFFFSSRRRHTRFSRDWSSDVCSSDLVVPPPPAWTGAERSTAAVECLVGGTSPRGPAGEPTAAPARPRTPRALPVFAPALSLGRMCLVSEAPQLAVPGPAVGGSATNESWGLSHLFRDPSAGAAPEETLRRP